MVFSTALLRRRSGGRAAQRRPILVHPSRTTPRCPSRSSATTNNRDGGLVSSTGGVQLRLTNLESVRAACGCPIDADTVVTPAEARKLADQLNALAGRARTTAAGGKLGDSIAIAATRF